jgi:hypothetical protein
MGLGSGIRDPGSGKNLIPDPGSRGQKGTGSRIPDPDPQHCLSVCVSGQPYAGVHYCISPSLGQLDLATGILMNGTHERGPSLVSLSI